MSHTFYQDERDEHRWGLGRYAGQRRYVSAEGKDPIQFPLTAFANEHCDNINLVELQKGMWCECCCHYHALFTLKGLKKVYQPLPQKGYDTPEQTFLNPGKYRSDWTSDLECFDDPYPEQLPPVDLTPGDDFWQRVAEHVSRYGLKVNK